VVGDGNLGLTILASVETRLRWRAGISTPMATAPHCADSAHIALERIPAEIDAIGVSQIPEAG